jgi:hypothetical protein
MLYGGFGRILREGMASFGDASVVRGKKGNRKFTGLRWKEILLGFQFTPKGIDTDRLWVDTEEHDGHVIYLFIYFGMRRE